MVLEAAGEDRDYHNQATIGLANYFTRYGAARNLGATWQALPNRIPDEGLPGTVRMLPSGRVVVTP
jgi:hypothetical protein